MEVFMLGKAHSLRLYPTQKKFPQNEAFLSQKSFVNCMSCMGFSFHEPCELPCQMPT